MTDIGAKRTKRSSSDPEILVSGIHGLKIANAKKGKTDHPVLSEAEKLRSELPQDFVVMDGQSRFRKITELFTFPKSHVVGSKGHVKPSGEVAKTKVKAKAVKIKDSATNDSSKKVKVKAAKKKNTEAKAVPPAKRTSSESLESLINAIRNLKIQGNKKVKFHSSTKGVNPGEPNKLYTI